VSRNPFGRKYFSCLQPGRFVCTESPILQYLQLTGRQQSVLLHCLHRQDNTCLHLHPGHLRREVTTFIQHVLSWESSAFLRHRKLRDILCKAKVHYRTQNSPPPCCILRHIKGCPRPCGLLYPYFVCTVTVRDFAELCATDLNTILLSFAHIGARNCALFTCALRESER
jgi:hypothetical protein